jgi:hypothetical protein
MNNLRFNTRFLDITWLVILTAFTLAGMMLATFHGDEAMQVYMSHDYVSAFIDHEPARLMVTPPYNIDDDPWLRILNGSINRYAIGLSWHLAGMNSGMLPPKPGWDWGLDYDTNVQTGHRPSEALMFAGRISSTLFLAVSTWVMFGLGRQIGGRLLAYIASGLYTLNPVILLNGRRAMMEGSMLCFGLLTILIATIIIHRRELNRRESILWWLALIVSGALALASKHTGILFVVGSFGWILMAELIRSLHQRDQNSERQPLNVTRTLIMTIIQIIVSGIFVIALFIALSPALWNDPPLRLRDLIEQRQFLLDIQVASDPNAPMPLSQRVEFIVKQPFIAPVAHFEVSFWANAAAIRTEIEQYMASPLSGLQAGEPGGIILTLVAGIGFVIIVRQWWDWRFGIIAWIMVTIASLLANPLPWQRYYLPWIPLVTLLAAKGIVYMLQKVSRTNP